MLDRAVIIISTRCSVSEGRKGQVSRAEKPGGSGSPGPTRDCSEGAVTNCPDKNKVDYLP